MILFPVSPVNRTEIENICKKVFNFASPDTGKQHPVGGEGAMQGITAPIDEEIVAAEIINLDVIEKVDQLMEEAEEDGMEYAVLQLSRLKEHIISLSR